MVPLAGSRSRRPRRLWRGPRLTALATVCAVPGAGAQPDEARILVDAAEVEGQIDPRLYGQFAEFMYEGVKGGLSAELIESRGFDAAPDNVGLSRCLGSRSSSSPRGRRASRNGRCAVRPRTSRPG